MNNKYLYHQKTSTGFTLIEVLVSLLIMGIALVSLNTLQAKITADNAFSRQRTEAVALAQTQLEAMRSFTTLAEFNTIQNSQDDLEGKNTTFTRDFQVTPLGNGLIQVNTIVTWPDRANNNNASQDSIITLSTVLTDALPSPSLEPVTLVHCSITDSCEAEPAPLERGGINEEGETNEGEDEVHTAVYCPAPPFPPAFSPLP